MKHKIVFDDIEEYLKALPTSFEKKIRMEQNKKVLDLFDVDIFIN